MGGRLDTSLVSRLTCAAVARLAIGVLIGGDVDRRYCYDYMRVSPFCHGRAHARTSDQVECEVEKDAVLIRASHLRAETRVESDGVGLRTGCRHRRAAMAGPTD